MVVRRPTGLDGASLWSPARGSLTADRDLESVLGAVTRLPLRYWRDGMLFFGAPDTELFELTKGCFPRKLLPDHSHPVFSLKALPGNVGFKVCPCSSKRPFSQNPFRLVKKGCKLLHTGHVVDRDTHLIEAFRFNIPPSVASCLSFKGEVPEACVETIRCSGRRS